MNLALFALRAVVGLTFSAHGAQKLFGIFGGTGLEGTAQMFDKLGLRPAWLHARLAGTAEFVGGLMLALGLLTAPVAATLTAVMTAAVITVHARNGFFVTKGGFEFNLVLVAAMFALVGAGAGAWSLDNALDVGLTGTAWALATLGVGVAGGVAAVVGGRSYHEPAHRRRGVGTPA